MSYHSRGRRREANVNTLLLHALLLQKPSLGKRFRGLLFACIFETLSRALGYDSANPKEHKNVSGY
jgi:hypothetical protein